MIWLDILLTGFIIICAVAALAVKDLLGAAILLGAYSFFIALLYAIQGAVDVAFTEASVGAGISTLLLIAGIYHTSRWDCQNLEKTSESAPCLPNNHAGRVYSWSEASCGQKAISRPLKLFKYGALFIVLITGVALIYGIKDMPDWGDPKAPASTHVAIRYEQSMQETATPNIVTAVLADYRGYDTFGETIVIFLAGIACLLLLAPKSKEQDTLTLKKTACANLTKK